VGVVGSGRGGRRERALLRGHSGRWPRSARGVRAGRESEEEEGGGGEEDRWWVEEGSGLESREAESERKRKASQRERERGRGGRPPPPGRGRRPRPVSCNFGLVPMRVAACGDCSCSTSARPARRSRARERVAARWGCCAAHTLPRPTGVSDAETP
jgi:hypothetical protein